MKTDGWPNPVRMILPGALDEAVGVLAADLDRAARLEQPHLLDHVQHQVGDVVDAVRAVGQDAARVDLGEVGVGAALGRGDAHLGRRGLVVELDPEALEQLFGPVARQRAVGQSAAVERVEVPVEVAGAERVPGVQLGGDAQVDEPVRLQRLPEVARRVRRDARADLGDALELGPAHRIGLDRGQLAGFLRVPLGEADHGVRGDAHGLELLALGVRVAVGRVVELRQAGVDVGLEVAQAPAVDLVVQHGVAGRALLHELGEDARLVRGQPLVRHLREEPLAHGLALPERDDLLGVDLPASPG